MKLNLPMLATNKKKMQTPLPTHTNPGARGERAAAAARTTRKEAAPGRSQRQRRGQAASTPCQPAGPEGYPSQRYRSSSAFTD